MKSYEKHALIKFTAIYFFSTAFFIIMLGYLYYLQQENLVLQKYTMKMHEYSMKLKQSNFTFKQKEYDFKIIDKNIFLYKLAAKNDKSYQKTFPIYSGEKFILVSLDGTIVDEELLSIKKFTIISQILLLLFFFFISLYLAKMSLKPMNDIISHLDRFVKDLIHDLNTPVTSIMLNTKMLKKQIDDKMIQNKLKRIENSAHAIGSLYENLEIVLKEKLPRSTIDLYTILEEKKEVYSFKYPQTTIVVDKKDMNVTTNEKAISRIIDNILSNACKYSKKDSVVSIYFENNKLMIQDNGKGIKYPNKIFERSYSEDEKGHGIGMHIVQRLCDNLDIKIDVDSKQNAGTSISLTFY
ncbi:MAG: HAMP domain-containing sensor histidine kinase [Campylobacterota bacterium]|nr:HAMP domain-containing sensor histidine kinase [Campylobacterota bacterium]